MRSLELIGVRMNISCTDEHLMDIRMPFDSELYPQLIHASHAHTALMPRMSARNQQPHASNSHTPLTVTWYTRCSKAAAVAPSPTLLQSLQNKHFYTINSE